MLTHVALGLTLPLAGVIAAAIAVAAHLIFRRFVPAEHLKEHHDVTAALFSVIGVLYSVVLAFLVGAVWTSFDADQQTADQEARFATNAYALATGLPEPQGSRLRAAIAQYAIEVRDVEWPMMRDGRTDLRARAYLTGALRIALSIVPPVSSTGQALRVQSIVNEMLVDLRSLGDRRVERMREMRGRLPAAIFESLILGAIAVMAFVFMFGIDRVVSQMALTAIFAFTIGLFFGLIVDLNSPYSGPITISPDAWNSVINAASVLSEP